MKNGELQTINEIQMILPNLKYTDEGIVELIHLVNTAIKIAESKNPDIRSNTCLKMLIQTKTNEVDLLLNSDYDQMSREDRFNDALSSFRSDLRSYCLKN